MCYLYSGRKGITIFWNGKTFFSFFRLFLCILIYYILYSSRLINLKLLFKYLKTTAFAHKTTPSSYTLRRCSMNSTNNLLLISTLALSFLRSLFVFCSSFVRLLFVFCSFIVRPFIICLSCYDCPCGSHRFLFVFPISSLWASPKLIINR